MELRGKERRVRGNDVKPVPVGFLHEIQQTAFHMRVVDERQDRAILSHFLFGIQTAEFRERRLRVQVDQQNLAATQGQALRETHGRGRFRRAALEVGNEDDLAVGIAHAGVKRCLINVGNLLDPGSRFREGEDPAAPGPLRHTLWEALASGEQVVQFDAINAAHLCDLSGRKCGGHLSRPRRQHHLPKLLR